MHAYETHVHVGQDRILRLELPVSESEMDLSILVIVNKIPASVQMQDTYGSCAGLGLQEPVDLVLQPLDWKL